MTNISIVGINLRLRVTHSGVLTLGTSLNKSVIRYVVELLNMSIYMYMAFALPLRVESICSKH